MLTSIMNFENRGKWGQSSYRGNCSGYVIKGLLEHFKPRRFTEVFAGGGTGFDVARDLGYSNSIHLDLRPEFGSWNALKDDMPSGADFVFSHPAYHDIIKYSGNMWGEAHPDDLSRCTSYEDFIKKLDHVNAKIFASLRGGGRHAILVGDVRRRGEYFSIIKDMNWIGKMEAHIIKCQHNTVSGRKSYGGSFIPIEHEHLLVFKKEHVWVIPVSVTKRVERDLRASDFMTWRDLTQAILSELGGQAPLQKIYEMARATEKAKRNQHIEAKIRQTLQTYKHDFAAVERGVWELVS